MSENDTLNNLRQMHQQRIAEYIASIQEPGERVVAIAIDQSDTEALAAAIEACAPQQVARWFCEVLNAQTAYFDVDERLWLTDETNDWRADEDTG